MFVTNWISTTKIQKISEITNFFRHYFLSRTEVSSAMAEVIDGLRYMLDPVKKTATLVPKREGKYSGDIIIPEKIKGNDGVEYVVTFIGCFLLQRLQWLNLYHHPLICYFIE